MVLSLPEHDAVLPNQFFQWWYWTGYLESACGRAFGFEFEFVLVRLFGDRVKAVTGHCALTDVENQQCHTYLESNFQKPETLAHRFRLHSQHGGIVAEGGGGHDSLRTHSKDFSFDLELNTARPAIRHYNGERRRFGFGGSTFYYSREKLEIQGSLSVGRERLEVTGGAWFDRQFGNLLPAYQNGWQWFFIQLDGDIQIMLYQYRTKGDGPHQENMGSITDAGVTSPLSPDDFSVKRPGNAGR